MLLQPTSPCGIFRAGPIGAIRCFPDLGRRSSVVEHVLGKDGVECSIHFGGTIPPRKSRPSRSLRRGVARQYRSSQKRVLRLLSPVRVLSLRAYIYQLFSICALRSPT